MKRHPTAYGIIAAVVVALVGLVLGAYIAQAVTVGPTYAGTAANDSSTGVYTWNTVGNITASDNAYATSSATGCSGGGVIDVRARIVKGGTIGSTNKAAVAWTTSDAFASYGGASDLWGETWTAADINASNFGFALSAEIATAAVSQVTYYAKATNFGFSIPTGATINGILVEVEKKKVTSGGSCGPP